jgi:H+/gluconate symporter-like permease
MDQGLSAVIIAIITGVFGVITLLIQRKQTKDISKIDQQANIIKKEKKLKNELAKSKENLEATIHQIMILILDTNLDIMKMNHSTEESSINDMIYEAEKLKNQFNLILGEIKEINHKYDTLLELTQDLNSSSDNRQS